MIVIFFQENLLISFSLCLILEDILESAELETDSTGWKGWSWHGWASSWVLLTCGVDFVKAWGLGFPLVLKSFVRQWEMEGVQDKQKGSVTERDKARQCFSKCHWWTNNMRIRIT